MGILNITPDSFSDGGQLPTVAEALRQAHALVQAGAHILDVGGESTRPGAEPVDASTERQRVLPVLHALVAEKLPVQISVDTTKASVAAASLEAGAHMINDISALSDPAMAALVARHNAGVVLMHMQGEPRSMQVNPLYHDPVVEISQALLAAQDKARRAGIAAERIWLDPGIGFGKSQAHNLQILRNLQAFCALGQPVVLGVSRKGFLGQLTGHSAPQDRDVASAATCVAAYLQGVRIFRVHNVAMARDALRVAEALAPA